LVELAGRRQYGFLIDPTKSHIDMHQVLVLGSNSFSGASFIGHWLDLGIDVVGSGRSPEPVAAMRPYK